MRTQLAAIWFLIVAVSALLVPANPAAAQSGSSFAPRIVAQAGGVTNSVAYRDGQLYFNVGPRIERMAVLPTAPDQPVKPPVSGTLLPGVPEDLKLAGQYLYLALGTAGVAIVDRTSLALVRSVPLPPATPTVTTTVSAATDLVVSSHYLYVAGGLGGILVYDLGAGGADLNLLQTKTFLAPMRDITDLEVQTTTAGGVQQRMLFASATNDAGAVGRIGGVLRFDITTSPTLDAPAAHQDGINLNALEVAGAYVYAAGASAFYVLNATSLVQVNAELPLPRPAAYLNLAPNGSTVYLMTIYGLDVVDVSTPAAPVLKTKDAFPTQSAAKDIASVDFAGYTNTYLYTADFDAGLSIVTSSTLEPQDLALLAPGYVAANVAISRIVAAGTDQAYEYGSSVALWALDISDPVLVKYLGQGVPVGVPVARVFNALGVQDDQVLASAAVAGLVRYRATPDGDPISDGEFRTGGIAYQAALAWPNAIVADGTNGLVLVNIDGDLHLTGQAPRPEINSDFRSVAAQGNYAYVVDISGMFRVYDLTDPTGPLPAGRVPLANMVDVKVKGNYAYVALGEKGVRVIDISDPKAPQLVGTGPFALPGLAQNLAIYQDWLLVAAGEAGVQILAIKPDGQLEQAGAIDTAGRALQLALSSKGVLSVADEDGGLVLIQFENFGYYFPLYTRYGDAKYFVPLFRQTN